MGVADAALGPVKAHQLLSSELLADGGSLWSLGFPQYKNPLHASIPPSAAEHASTRADHFCKVRIRMHSKAEMALGGLTKNI